MTTAKEEILNTLTKDKQQAMSAADLYKVNQSFVSAQEVSTTLGKLYSEGVISRKPAPPGGMTKFVYWNEPFIKEHEAPYHPANNSIMGKFLLIDKPAPIVTKLPAATHDIIKTGNALNTQVAGSHYKDMKIQPVEYIIANELGFCEGNVVKYVSRYKNKNGVEDLKKARHFLDILIEQQG